VNTWVQRKAAVAQESFSSVKATGQGNDRRALAPNTVMSLSLGRRLDEGSEARHMVGMTCGQASTEERESVNRPNIPR
jgi:hypothetical protein